MMLRYVRHQGREQMESYEDPIALARWKGSEVFHMIDWIVLLSLRRCKSPEAVLAAVISCNALHRGGGA